MFVFLWKLGIIRISSAIIFTLTQNLIYTMLASFEQKSPFPTLRLDCLFHACVSTTFAQASAMSEPVNVRRIILKHRRAGKCPFLDKFIALSLAPCRGGFLTTKEIFTEFCTVVALWTDGDSVDGQTSHLMKEKSFHKVRLQLIHFV